MATAEQSKHIRTSFDAALYAIRNDVLMMSSLTDRMFQTAVEGLLSRDGDCEHVRTLKLKDRELDALIDEITETFGMHMAQQSELVPGYLDLIFVARAFEEIGDKSANIAEDAFWRYRAEDIRHT